MACVALFWNGPTSAQPPIVIFRNIADVSGNVNSVNLPELHADLNSSALDSWDLILGSPTPNLPNGGLHYGLHVQTRPFELESSEDGIIKGVVPGGNHHHLSLFNRFYIYTTAAPGTSMIVDVEWGARVESLGTVWTSWVIPWTYSAGSTWTNDVRSHTYPISNSSATFNGETYYLLGAPFPAGDTGWDAGLSFDWVNAEGAYGLFDSAMTINVRVNSGAAPDLQQFYFGVNGLPPSDFDAGGTFDAPLGSELVFGSDAIDADNGSTDPGEGIVWWEWTVVAPDQSVFSIEGVDTLAYTFGELGDYAISLTVTDDEGWKVTSDFLIHSRLPGDANGDNLVSGADYTIWADNYGAGPDAVFALGDFNLDGQVTGADYTIWADHFGQQASPTAVPEPSTWALLSLSMAWTVWQRVGRRWYESRRLLRALLAASCLMALGWVRSAPSEDIFWVGYQFGPSGGLHPNPFPTASFFHEDQWFNRWYPGQAPGQDGNPANDVAVFDEGFDPQGNGMPKHVYFGDYVVDPLALHLPSPVPVPGGDARVDLFAVRRGGFTFDFGSPINNSVGSLTTSGVSIGFGDEANTYTGARFVGGGEVEVNGNVVVGGNDPTGLEINGSTLRNTSTYLGADENASTHAEVAGSDSTWIHTDALVVGGAGFADLTIRSGATVEGRHAHLGAQTGAEGDLTVRGGGSTLTLTEWLIVGNSGDGQLAIESGATVENQWSILGAAPGARGVATVAGNGAAWRSADWLMVGDLAEGELTIADGATVESRNARLGSWPGSRGEASVVGSGSTWSTDRFMVGPEGTARVSIDSGGTVQSHQAFLGATAVGSGEVSVSGAGSSFVATDEIQVGASGTGRLTVSDDATVQSGHANLGHEVGGHGEATVIGSGSTWTLTDWINVGNHGAGHLTIDSGGTVACTWGDLGWQASGFGSATLSSGATWSAADYLTVGRFGEGELAIHTGATARSDYRFVVASSGSGRVSVDSGGNVQCFESFVGEYAGSDGEVNVSDAGSSFVATDELQVGASGTGRLTASHGASVETAEAAIGAWAGGFGSAAIESGAAWHGSQWLAVGYEGTGDLAIRSAATTTVPEFFVAFSAGSFGSVTLHGSGSKLRSSLGIYVGGSNLGPGGIGTLNLLAGGTIETPLLVIHQADSVTLSTGGRAAIGNLGAVAGAADTVTVGAGGTLRGVGTINGIIANLTGGTLSPGLPVGLLTINGNLDHGHSVAGAGGTLEIQINAAGIAGADYDSLVVGGHALLGGQLNLVVAGGYVPKGADRFDVVVADQISGAFESINHRVISGSGVGQVVWGDYRVEAPGPADDRYYVAPRLMADFNGVGGVTGADFTIWADNFGMSWATFGEGDANGDRRVTGADFTLWADNFGQASFVESIGPIESGNELVFPASASAETAVFNYRLDLRAMPDEEIHVPAHAVPEPDAWLILTISLALLPLLTRRFHLRMPEPIVDGG